ncbi:MAG: glycerophosphodiester phosphodiesterase family protein [Methyloceanibacter sp.]|uniref:glycerophosphodiester phosphodiesterase family protein n=1 Tax=Methyloceanibacter sp. TaxID=1965321 RepID=UPI003D9BDBAA
MRDLGELGWLRRPIAHRGLHDASRFIIENSASSIEAAIDKGYGVELDLQCTGDKRPVVFHDLTLGRLTAQSGPLRTRTAEALSRIALRGSSDRILTLPQLLDLVAGRIPLLLEAKSTWTEDRSFAASIAEALAVYQGPVAVMSFDPNVVAAFRTLAPSLPRGLVAGGFEHRRFWSHRSPLQRFAMRHLLTSVFARPHFIAYDVHELPALAPYTARRIFGLPLVTWTVRSEEDRVTAARYADAMIFEGFQP